MLILSILCGVPGSGKTTYAREHLCLYNEYVSREEIRSQLLGSDDDYFSQENVVWGEFVRQIAAHLNRGQNTVADCANLTPKIRKRLLSALSILVNVPFTIHYYAWCVPLDVCLTRNAMRKGRALMSQAQVKKMFQMYLPPIYSEDERISIIFQVDEKGKVVVPS